MGGARDRHWLESSFLLVFNSCSPLGSQDLGQVEGGGWGAARVWPTGLLGRVWGLGLAASLPTKFFSQLVASGPLPRAHSLPRKTPKLSGAAQMGHAGPSFVKL